MLSVFLYWRYRWWCFQYLHTGDTDGDSSVFTYWRCRWWCADGTSVASKVQTLLRQAWCGSKRPSPKGGVVMLQWDCIILGHMSRSDLKTSVFENEEGLYHPGTYVQKWSSDFGHRECGRIVSSLNFGSERIWWTSVIEKVVGLYHPWTLVQNGFGDCIIPGHMSRIYLVNFDHREGGRIVSSLNFDSEWIRWTSVIEKVVGLYHPCTSVQNGSDELQSSRRW